MLYELTQLLIEVVDNGKAKGSNTLWWMEVGWGHGNPVTRKNGCSVPGFTMVRHAAA
jgi:hypothetical protein